MKELYRVVGCSDCNAVWLYKGEQKTTMCRRCGKQHQTDSLRVHGKTADKDEAQRIRTRVVLEQSNVDSDEIDISKL